MAAKMDINWLNVAPAHLDLDVPDHFLVDLTGLVIPPLRVKQIEVGNLYIRKRRGRKEFVRKKLDSSCIRLTNMSLTAEQALP